MYVSSNSLQSLFTIEYHSIVNVPARGDSVFLKTTSTPTTPSYFAANRLLALKFSP
jgi:hypothetical protein